MTRHTSQDLNPVYMINLLRIHFAVEKWKGWSITLSGQGRGGGGKGEHLDTYMYTDIFAGSRCMTT